VLSVAEAARAVLAKLPRLHVERVAIDDARGRVLAENIVATRALPGFDNSAMDGLGGRRLWRPRNFSSFMVHFGRKRSRIAAGYRDNGHATANKVSHEWR
jgi:molybdopterin biosynthesis enzyme